MARCVGHEHRNLQLETLYLFYFIRKIGAEKKGMITMADKQLPSKSLILGAPTLPSLGKA